MRLSELLDRLPGAQATADPALEIREVSHDSRRLGAGALFVAVRGLTVDGNDFVEAALRKGAAAIVSEAPAQPGAPWVQVPDAREALATVSAALLGEPARALELIGVTGTNGKTTTTYLIDAGLRAAGHKVGLLGTVQYRVGDRLQESVRTTPESSDLQALLREMVDAGCRDVVMEVSSHALALKRVHGCPFRVAVFTNLTRDHLDFHGDMDRYFAAKRVLFDTLLRNDGHAIVNAEDPRADELRRVSRGTFWTFALDRAADLRADNLSLSLAGTRFRAHTPLGDVEIRSPLLGRFNAQNLMGALGALLALGVPPETAATGLGALNGVPGRLEQVQAGQGFTLIVDYAHTDDALRNLLETVRELGPRRVLTVFGCGGDRDRTKRPLMGAVASRMSDVVIVTSDNPRSEPPEAIIEEVQRGLAAGSRETEHHVRVDRREAIALAISLAQPGDVVVLAGKGHETTQVLRDRAVPFDDRRVARDLLASLPASGVGA